MFTGRRNSEAVILGAVLLAISFRGLIGCGEMLQIVVSVSFSLCSTSSDYTH